MFRLTAARTRSCKAFSMIFSPSRKSIARRTFPSQLESNRPVRSFSEARGLADHPGADHPVVVPGRHTAPLPSSTTSGSASWIRPSSMVPRQSPSSLILASISPDGFGSFNAMPLSAAIARPPCLSPDVGLSLVPPSGRC
jgi:hypothetical protein